uniref:Transmembrane protein 50A n=1 Tax=Aceria tosichella TaxID=561515 RepID=A0A6G1S775_9ACAR
MEFVNAGITSLQRHVRESLDISEKRNIIASMAAGIFFFSGWWIIIDVGARYTSQDFHGAFYLFGIFGTLSFIIVNSISNSQLRDEGFDTVNPRAAKACLLVGFILGFSALTGSVWVLISEYASSKHTNAYPGVALLLQNILIFLGSLIFKFGRTEDQ